MTIYKQISFNFYCINYVHGEHGNSICLPEVKEAMAIAEIGRETYNVYLIFCAI